jgi:hypothetical protein
VTSFGLTSVPLSGDVSQALAAIPAAPGVGQIVGPEERNLVIGRGAHLRRWAASHLGQGKAPRPGVRPPTNLAPIATAIAYAETTSAFHQRLVYERLMARYVPMSARRDLKPPAYLHLDPAERFPRIVVRRAKDGREALYGPFRDPRKAEAARQRLHKLLPLRPCDYVFEPDPNLPLGLGCVYAQVSTCAAPCLSRVNEDAYRALASEAASLLSRPSSRPAELEDVVPSWVTASKESAGLVAENGALGIELYPIRDGTVLETVRVGTEESLSGALAGLRWTPKGGDAYVDDTPWLAQWLSAPRRTGTFLVVDLPVSVPALQGRLRDKLGSPEER